MDRPFDNRPIRHNHDRSVREQGRVERGEGAAIVRRDAGQVSLGVAAAAPRGSEALGADAGRKTADVRGGGVIAAVDEDERRRSIAVPLERLHVSAVHARGAVDGHGKPRLGNRRDAREPPLLVARGRQAELAEALDGLLARSRQPCGIRRAALACETFGFVYEEVLHSVRGSAFRRTYPPVRLRPDPTAVGGSIHPYPLSSSSSASSLPPDRTIRPSVSTW